MMGMYSFMVFENHTEYHLESRLHNFKYSCRNMDGYFSESETSSDKSTEDDTTVATEEFTSESILQSESESSGLLEESNETIIILENFAHILRKFCRV